MSRRVRGVVAAPLVFPLAAALVLSACSAAEPRLAEMPRRPTSAQQTTVPPATTAAPQPTAAPEATAATPTVPPRQPLTGLPGGSHDPVVAVKIDNAVPARPQQGLAAADVVFEELVEGGTTRFLALFQSRLPEKVGPVRSGREVDAALLPAFDPLLVFSGAAAEVHRDVAKSGLALVDDEAERFDRAFERTAERSAPYNLYLKADGLRAALADRPPGRRPWEIGAVEGRGQRLKGIELSFSPWATAGWSWNGEAWTRSQDGAPHELVNGDVLAAENVVVMRVPTARGRRTDAAGNPTVEITVTGKGKALILRDGRVYRAEWIKPDAASDLVWRTGPGRRLPLAPGKAWIELVPKDGDVELVGAKKAG